MVFRSLMVFWFSSFVIVLHAQSAFDALDQSMSGPYGSARNVATMNTLDALGADVSAIISNPAGIANFRRAEFAFTTGMEIFRSESKILNTRESQKSSSTRMQLDQIGLVLTSQPKNNAYWKQFNFGFNYQKIDSYQKEYAFSDVSTLGSISESFLERADGRIQGELDPFYEGLAYGTVLIFDEEEEGRYYIDLPEDPEIEKSDHYETQGSSRTNTFSFGANYDNTLLFGINLSFPAFRYEIKQEYSERDASDQYAVFKSINFDRNGISNGDGFNTQLGLIYNVNRALRVSLSSQTPTWYSVQISSYTADLNYKIFEQGTEQNLETLSPEQSFEYKLRTPWQHRLGLGSVIGKKGFVSASVMYKDFSQLNYTFGDSELDQENERVQNNQMDSLFSESWTIGVGGEYRVTDHFNVRLGAGYETSPYSLKSDITRFSGGLGWRWKSFYLDLAYLNERTSETYRPYSSDIFPTTQTDQSNTNHRINLSIGFKI